MKTVLHITFWTLGLIYIIASIFGWLIGSQFASYSGGRSIGEHTLMGLVPIIIFPATILRNIRLKGLSRIHHAVVIIAGVGGYLFSHTTYTLFKLGERTMFIPVLVISAYFLIRDIALSKSNT